MFHIATNGGQGVYARLRETVKVFDTHYSKVAGKAWRGLLDAQFRGNDAEAEQYRNQIRKLADVRSEVMDLLADELTSVAQIQATRRALREAADAAFRFLKALKKAKMTLDDLANVVGFAEQLVKDIRKIL